MKLRSLWIVILAVCSSSLADEASHREAAARLLEITDAEKTMMGVFKAMMDSSVPSTLRQFGMPDTATQEVKDAFNQWYSEEMKWEEIKPKVVEVYVQQFSEVELKELCAFFETPTGQKAFHKWPLAQTRGIRIGTEYAQSKKPLFQLKLKAIAEKYAPKKGQ